MSDLPTQFDPELDLVIDRVVDVPTELVWRAWTTPEHVREWFVPRPWTITECRIDLRPGGVFRTVMQSPEGDEYPNEGCFLEIEDQRKLVFTDALGPGYRPADEPFFTAIVTMEPTEGGTHYVARAIHGNRANREKHEAMGFHDGWSTVLDQLVEYVKGGAV